MTTRRFRIRNWAKFQHYKDRNPPWIKLHVEILGSEDWVMLDDAGKLLAVACMVIAAKHDGFVPDNPDYIQRVAYLGSRPNLKPLIACGFLENPQADESESKHPKASARPEKEGDTEAEKESITSADADPSKPSAQPQSGKRNPYPEPFEAFWRDYPTDPLMSKKKAFAQWERLSPQDRDAARAAIPAFQSHCRKNPSYRPVHAERFISERRFDGFNAASAPPVDEGAAKALWGGDAAKLVEQIGAASFEAYFANVRYDPGPPARFAAPTPFIRDRIATKFASKIKAAYGEFELVTAQ